MRNSSRRTTKLIGSALFAAAIAATSVATVSTVSADIGDLGGAGYIRVKPDPAPNTRYEKQTAPVLEAGTNGGAAGSVQILINTEWESGDVITLQVQSDAAGFGAGSQVSCLSAAQSISFAGPYVLADTAVAGPFLFSPWSFFDFGTSNPGTDNPGASDVPVADITNPSVAPTFTVALTTSPSCLGVGVTDQIEITFSNTGNAVPANSDQFVITFNNIRYNVGAGVNPGPVHVIPFAREAVDAAPGTYLSKGTFGGNFYSPVVVNMWTNNAYVAPVKITSVPTNIVGDNAYQPLGNITLTELAPDALGNGTHIVCLSTVNEILNPLTLTVTGGGGGTAVSTGTCITVTLAGTNPAAAGTVVISGLVGRASGDGAIVATLLPGTGGLWPAYLSPDDQFLGAFGGDSTFFSDVNLGANPTSAIGVAFAVPNRIGGNDRYETSAKIAANVDSCGEWAVVVSGTSYPDALSANHLAGALTATTPDDVPVLLVGTDSVPPSVAAYMSAAGVKNVFIVGGTAAVSAAVQTALQATSATKCTGVNANNSTNPVAGQKLNVVRISGADRYATNRAVVNVASDYFNNSANMIQLEFLQPSRHTAIVATGTAFADALAAGPASYDGIPLVLTDGTTLSANAAGALTDNDITQVIIIGGTAAVSDAVKTSIEALGIITGRISGADRYATATAWADFMAKGGPTASVAGAFDGGLGWGTPDGLLLTSGTNFADALSGGPLGWNWGVPIILTDPAVLSAATQTWLVANKTTLNYVTVLGLGTAVTTSVMNAANAAIS